MGVVVVAAAAAAVAVLLSFIILHQIFTINPRPGAKTEAHSADPCAPSPLYALEAPHYNIMLLNRFAFEYRSESKCLIVLPAHL